MYSHGIYSYTKINLMISSANPNQFVYVDELYECNKKYETRGKHMVICYIPTQNHIFGERPCSIRKFKGETYKYLFRNIRNQRKRSIGTEEFLISTPDCPILKYDGSHVPIGDLKIGDDVMSIKTSSYNLDIEACISTLYYSFRYLEADVYTLSISPIRSNFGNNIFICANGFLIGDSYVK